MKLFKLIALAALILAAVTVAVLVLPSDASGRQKTGGRCVYSVVTGICYQSMCQNLTTGQLETKSLYDQENDAILAEKVGKEHVFIATVTAYNSVEEQTDDDPCIAADGTDICYALRHGERACAANGFRFGTRLDVPGIGQCVVRDRTASRFGSRIDVYFGGRGQIKAAKEWGIKRGLTIKIIE